MADQIEQIVTALTGCCAECADRAEHIAWAIHEHAHAGLLASPEHDAAVAAKALREAADDVRATLNVDQSRPLTIEQAMHAVDFWLRGRADRIGREAGESGADT